MVPRLASAAPVGRWVGVGAVKPTLASAAPMQRWMGEAREPTLASLVPLSGFSQ